MSELEIVEEELRSAKRFNKAAGILIILMMILMGCMLYSLQQCSRDFERLEVSYERLYEELGGGTND